MNTTGWPGGHLGGPGVQAVGASPNTNCPPRWILSQLASLWLGGICSELRQSAPAQGGEQTSTESLHQSRRYASLWASGENQTDWAPPSGG